MDYLWTPWRYSYLTTADTSSDGGACVFCGLLTMGDDAKALIVHRAEYNFIVLNAYPYTSGHSMIVPYEHVDRLHKLSQAAADEMMALARHLELAFLDLYRPDGVNIGMNIGKAAGPAPLDCGRKLHDRHRRDSRAARVAGDDLPAAENEVLTDSRRAIQGKAAPWFAINSRNGTQPFWTVRICYCFPSSPSHHCNDQVSSIALIARQKNACFADRRPFYRHSFLHRIASPFAEV
jgi:ATP adenylyltransferase